MLFFFPRVGPSGRDVGTCVCPPKLSPGVPRVPGRTVPLSGAAPALQGRGGDEVNPGNPPWLWIKAKEKGWEVNWWVLAPRRGRSARPGSKDGPEQRLARCRGLGGCLFLAKGA